MKIKLFIFILKVITFTLVSVTWGEINVREATIGRWERYDPKYKGKEAMEFFKDGSISLFHEGLGLSVAGDYKFIDNNHIKVNLGGFWTLVGPIICKISVSGNKLILTTPDGEVAEYNRVSSKVIYHPKKTTGGSQKIEKQADQQIAGYLAKIENINLLLPDNAVLECPEEGSCNDYEEEAAKALISHLSSKKAGKWLYGYLVWQVAKKLIMSGLDDLIEMAISLGEVQIEKIVKQIKHKYEKSKGADVKIVSLGWKDIGVLPIYLPYKNKDGPYGNVDGEALMIFYSPHSISIKEIKKQIASRGGRFSFYIPPLRLDEKVRQLPDEGIVRPFKLIIRGTVHEEGEVKVSERWGKTIKGPRVTFLDHKETVSPKVQITSSLRILEPPPYKVKQMITAEFSIKNNGGKSVVFDVLTVGGRVNDICPQDKCPDFEWKRNVTLKPNETYIYKGKLKIEKDGEYHFFTTYKLKDGIWNTAIPKAPGVKNTADIIVTSTSQDSNEKRGSHRVYYVMDIFERRPKKIFSGYTGGFMPTWSPDSKKVAIRTEDYSIYVIYVDDGKSFRLPLPDKGYSFSWSPDGKKMVLQIGFHEVAIIDISDTKLIKIKPPAERKTSSPSWPEWSPDGKKVAFAVGGGLETWSIYIMDADGSNLKRLTRGNKFSWSPNGRKIAYVNEASLYLIDIYSSKQIKLVENVYINEYAIGWSPDGRKIAFCGGEKLYVVDADGGIKKKLAEIEKHARTPNGFAWSPDGKKILYQRDGNIYIISADGIDNIKLGEGKNPAWSPDGNKIVFEKGEKIYLTNIDGTDRVELADGYYPQWSRDGGKIAFIQSEALSMRRELSRRDFVQPCTDAGGYYGWLEGQNNNHLGQDYNAPAGTKVKAIAKGCVWKIINIMSNCYDPTTGKELPQTFIWIKHRLSDGRYFYALYGHVDPLENIKEGTEIKEGQDIGKIKICYVWHKNKLVSVPHLHFGIWDNESPPPTAQLGYGPIRSFTDPLNFLRQNKPW